MLSRPEIEKLELTREKAEKGDVHAQFQLAQILEFGKGVPEDPKEAVNWYHKAAEQGDNYSQLILGIMFEYGQHVLMDHEQAIYWYRKGAEKGYRVSKENLGRILAEGNQQEKEEAVKRNCKSAKDEYVSSPLPANSLDIELKLKAEKGDKDAQFLLGEDLDQDLLDETPVESQIEATNWYLKAAGQGHVKAQSRFSHRLHMNRGIPTDPTEAFKIYYEAGQQGYSFSQLKLGLMLEYGQGIDSDLEQAVYWYRKAAEQGCGVSQHKLGLALANGIGVAKNEKEAEEWFLKAEKGDYIVSSQLATESLKKLRETFSAAVPLPTPSLQSTTLRIASLLVPCERKEAETSKDDEFFKDAVKIKSNLNLPSDVSKPSFWMNLTTVANSFLPSNPFTHAPAGQNEKPKGSRLG